MRGHDIRSTNPQHSRAQPTTGQAGAGRGGGAELRGGPSDGAATGGARRVAVLTLGGTSPALGAAETGLWRLVATSCTGAGAGRGRGGYLRGGRGRGCQSVDTGSLGSS